MMLLRYRQVLSRPQVLPVFVAGTLCRLPNAAAGVVVTLFVVGARSGSYAQAGLVATAMTVGAAIGAPRRGLLLDRIGLRATLAPSVLVEGAVWFALPLLSYRWLLFAALIGGLFAVPVHAVIRQSLSALVEPTQQRTVFSLDSIATELSYLVGPAAGAALATTWSASGSLVLVGVSTVVAGAALMVMNPPLTGPGDPGAESSGAARSGSPRARFAGCAAAVRELVSVPLVMVLAATVTALLVIGAIDVSVVAFTQAAGRPDLTWVVLVLWSLSSLVGLVVFGGGERTPSVYVLLLGACALAVPVGFAPGAWWLALFVVPTGLLGAPLLAATGAEVIRWVPVRRRGEAMGWYSCAMTVGLGLGTPFAGWAIDTAGPWAGFTWPAAIGVVVALLGLFLIRLAIDRPIPQDEISPSGELVAGVGAQSGASPTLRQSTEV